VSALGLPALHARQGAQAGVLGVVGFAALVLAAAYHLYLLLYEAYATPLLAEDPATRGLVGTDGPLAHGAGALGPIAFATILAFPLFGVATLRAHVFPRGAAWLQIVSLLVLIAAVPLVNPDEPAPLGTSITTPLAWMYLAAFLGYAWCGCARGCPASRAP
jgi:hypothetical protein